MIGRGANEWQSERPIDPVLERNHFQRNKTLVVVHRNNSIIIALVGVIKKRVCTYGAANINSSALQFADGRADSRLFFSAHLPALTGVRVQAANTDSSSG